MSSRTTPTQGDKEVTPTFVWIYSNSCIIITLDSGNEYSCNISSNIEDQLGALCPGLCPIISCVPRGHLLYVSS